MLINFFLTLRKYKVPVSIRELMDLLAGLKHQLAYANVDDFYLLSRTAMVKDEKNYDKFDRAFSAYFKGLEDLHGLLESLIPDEWLRREFEKSLTPEELAQIESLGGLEKLIEAFKEAKEAAEKAEAEKGKEGDKGDEGDADRDGKDGPGGQGRGKKKKAKKVAEKKEIKETVESATLFVRNIGFETNERKFRAFMEKFGPVKYAVLCKTNGLRPEDTTKEDLEAKTAHKGTGFVKFLAKEPAF